MVVIVPPCNRRYRGPAAPVWGCQGSPYPWGHARLAGCLSVSVRVCSPFNKSERAVRVEGSATGEGSCGGPVWGRWRGGQLRLESRIIIDGVRIGR